MADPSIATSRRVVVATHGHCFDGAASAAVFSRMLAAIEVPPLAFAFRACTYGPGPNVISDAVFDGEINALLDFRYSTSPRLSWYFDHHKTAFVSPVERDHFASDRSGRRFHDDAYGSCTRLVADVARERFGFRDPGLDELVTWAETIDAARFDTPDQAVSRELPALQIMSVIEHKGDGPFLGKVVPLLASKPLGEIAAIPMVRDAWRILSRKLGKLTDRIRLRSVAAGDVVLTDLSDAVSDVVGKYIPYVLFPDASYSVVLSRSRHRIKISVGFNPWSPRPRRHDIANICARYGGGGHPVVGAAAFALDQLETARQVARTIADELNQPPVPGVS